MKRLVFASLFCIAAAVGAFAAQPALRELAGASGQYVSNVNNNAVHQVSIPQAALVKQEAGPAGITLPQPKKKWTIMIFVNGKNNLSGAGDTDLKEMQGVGSDKNINVIVEKGNMVEDSSGTASFGAVQRLYVANKGWFRPAEALVLKSSNMVDMGDWKEVVSFAKYAKQNFPAEKYMLVLWNHGSGWISIGGKPMEGSAPASNETLARGVSSAPASSEESAADSNETIGRGISYDDETGNHITTIEMRALLKEIGGVDVLASDACLMADIAVDAEVNKYAKFVAASEEVEPGKGYDYTILLKKFAKNPGMDASAAAIAVVDAYAESYKKGSRDVTTSAVESVRVVTLSRGMKTFVDKALVSPDKKALVKAYKEANRFAYDHAADLYDFLRILSTNTTDKDLKIWSEMAMRVLKDAVVVKNVAYGRHTDKAYGIACYLPLKNRYDSEYDKLMFAKYTNWGALVKMLKAESAKQAASSAVIAK